MKSIAAILGVVAMLTVAGNADAKNPYAGVKGGVNMASLSGDGTDDLDSRNGFDGGAFYGSAINDRFGARLEALYVQKGAEGPFPNPEDGDIHESVIKLAYLEFPVLVTAAFPAGDKLDFELFAGPTFGFNMKAEIEVPEHGETEDLDDFVKSFEFGGAIGGGIEYMLSSFSIIADVRYTLAFTKLADAGDSDTKNRGIGIMGGIKFPLGGE